MKIKQLGILALFTLALTVGGFTENVSAATSVFVKDDADILTPETEQKIIDLNENTFKSYDSFPQLAVYTIESIPEGFDIDSYTNELFEDLGVGQSEYDNGLLFVLSEQDREYRLETGYGMEHIIVDGMHGRIVDDTATNYLKANDFDKAISGVVDNIGAIVIDSEYGEGTALTIEEREAIEARRDAILQEQFKGVIVTIAKVAGGLVVIGLAIGFATYLYLEKRKKERQEAFEKSKAEVSKMIVSQESTIEKYLIEKVSEKVDSLVKSNSYKYEILNKDMSIERNIIKEKSLEDLKPNMSTENLQSITDKVMNDPELKTKDSVIEMKTSILDRFKLEDYGIFGVIVGISYNKYLKELDAEYTSLVKETISKIDDRYSHTLEYVLSKSKESTIEGLYKVIAVTIKEVDTMIHNLDNQFSALKEKVLSADVSQVTNTFKTQYISFTSYNVGFATQLLMKGQTAFKFIDTLQLKLASLYVECAIDESHIDKRDVSSFLSTNSSKFEDWFEVSSKNRIVSAYTTYHNRKEREREEERRREHERQIAIQLAAQRRRDDDNNSSSGFGGGGGSSFGGGSSGGGGFSGSF